MPDGPRWLTKAKPAERKAGDGDHVAEFVATYCRQVKDTVAGRVGDPLELRQWQVDLLAGLFARRRDGRRRFRTALVGLPRKNGKSALGSSVALCELFTGPQGGEVYSCAADRDQARIVFGVAKRMIEGDPELSGMAKLYRDAVEVPETGSVYRVLSSEAFTKEGLSPTLVVFDEVHAQPSDELWNVMTLGSGARVDPLVLGITTAGVMTDGRGRQSLCHRLWEYGTKVASGEVDDPSFFFSWWAAAPDSDHADPAVWRGANPGFGDLIDPEDFESTVRQTPENEFRTKRLNLWVSSAEAWLPFGAWDGLERGARPDSGTRVVLGFDGSYGNDSTALVGCTVGDDPVMWVEGLWERPEHAEDGWRVPVSEVVAKVEAAFAAFDVVELAYDPFIWRSETERWEDAFGSRVVAFNTTSPARIAPACTRFYTAVADGLIAHDHDPALARHLGNAVTKETPQGTVIVKDSKMSPRKIDAAVAAVVAYDRAQWHSAQSPTEAGFVGAAFV